MSTKTASHLVYGSVAPGFEAVRLEFENNFAFRNELGARILAQICSGCWKDWLQHQTLLINHYGLDPRDKKARAFLYEQIEQVLLGDGDGKDIDTSKQGTIEW